MKDILGRTAAALTRSTGDLTRLAALTLNRDKYLDQDNPADPTPVWLGERTVYRAAAVILDRFQRAALGAAWGPWASLPGLAMVDDTAVGPEAPGTDLGLLVHTLSLPREQSVETTIRTLDAGSGSAAVGVGLRLSADAGYLVVGTAPAGLAVYRYAAGVLAATVTTDATIPWLPGDVLRATADYARIEVWRNQVRVASVTDTDWLIGGFPGIVAQADGDGVATVTDLIAGPLRQEYVGLILDLQDVTQSLGLQEPTAAPASWTLRLSNQAPIGGATRFAYLIRHGLNAVGSYDLPRSGARVYTVLAGGSSPIGVATGLIEDVTALTRDAVDLACAGVDRFLSPAVTPAPVTYLPGPVPGGDSAPAPIPLDPCADEEQTVIPGDPPDEPTDADTPPGPEPGPEEDDEDEEEEGLLGTYLVLMEYTMNYGGGPMGEDVYEGSTTILQKLPWDTPPFLPGPGGAVDLTDNDGAALQRRRIIGSGSEAFPDYFQEIFIYRGPDSVGGHLGQLVSWVESVNSPGIAYRGIVTPGSFTDWTITAKVAEYDPEGILTEDDLTALRPMNPGEISDPFPTRIGTLQTMEIHWDPAYNDEECSLCAFEDDETPDIHNDHLWAGGIEQEVNVTWERYNFEVDYARPFFLEVPLNRFAGPQIIRMEIDSVGVTDLSPTAADVKVLLTSSNFVDEVYQQGLIGSAGRICAYGLTYVHLTERQRFSMFPPYFSIVG